MAHTPLGKLTGPPAVFQNTPAVWKVKNVMAAEERFTAGWISTAPEGPQKGPHLTVAHLKDAPFHNKRIEKETSLLL